MQTVLEQGSIDKPLTFDVGLIQFSFIPVCSLKQHFSQIVPRVCTSVLFIVNIFKKRDREDPGNYRGIITLLSDVGKVFCKFLNNRLVQCLDKEGALHEGQTGFRLTQRLHG